jgi:hypothetical protein
MMRDETHAALQEAMAAIRDAAEKLRPHTGLFERYARERELMDSVGPIFDPTLFKSQERVEADAIVGPTFDAARQFIRAIETQTLLALESALKLASREER